MFIRQLDASLALALTLPHFAPEIFRLVEANRERLREWLPWVDKVQEEAHVRSFIASQIEALARGQALHATILQEGRMVGVIAYNAIDRSQRAGTIGYWLDQAAQGQGIMTKAVSGMIQLGRELFALRRFEIHCATKNARSRAIPERLGFRRIGTKPLAERISGTWHFHEVYALSNEPS